MQYGQSASGGTANRPLDGMAADGPHEETRVHTRLSRCTLEVEAARAYWARAAEAGDVTAVRAFTEFWFGARSMPRVQVLLSNMRARFDAYPPSLAVLGRWPHMSVDTRRLICHWHLQLSDPLYRQFTGTYLPERRSWIRPEVTLDPVADWTGQQQPGRWSVRMRLQLAGKLLTAAHAVGLTGSSRGPRILTLPQVPGEALEYLMYLLRETEFEGTLPDNPYTRSVGLDSDDMTRRLRLLPGLSFQRQGDLVDFGWKYPGLRAWASTVLAPQPDEDLNRSP